MSPIDKIQASRGSPWRGLSVALAGLGCLATCVCAIAQVSVDTIGGGVRVECGPAYGFTNGNTYDTAQFNAPYSCALDTNGNLWIADKNNNDLEQVSEAGNKATSITTEYYATNVVGGHTVTNFHSFTNITSVAVDSANNLYFLLPSPPLVYQCDLTGLSTTLNVLSALAITNAPADAVASAMAVDGRSNVFIAFTNGVIIRVQMLASNPPPARVPGKLYIGSLSRGALYRDELQLAAVRSGYLRQWATGGERHIEQRHLSGFHQRLHLQCRPAKTDWRQWGRI